MNSAQQVAISKHTLLHLSLLKLLIFVAVIKYGSCGDCGVGCSAGQYSVGNGSCLECPSGF